MTMHIEIRFKQETGIVTYVGEFEGATKAEAKANALESLRSKFGEDVEVL